MRKTFCHALIIITFLFTIIFAQQNPVAVSGNGNNEINPSKLSTTISTGFKNLGYIIINGDADFAHTAVLEGWPGNGTFSKPYVIDHYNFTGSDLVLIDISDTDVFFRISNCIFSGTNNQAIQLSNVRNGIIFNCCFHDSLTGIRLDSSTDIILERNQFFGLELESNAIILHESTYNIITHNVMRNNSEGIYLSWLCEKNIIIYNTIDSNNGGVSLETSSENYLINNSLINSSKYGLRITSDSERNIIELNNFIDNGDPEYFGQAVDDGLNNNFTYNYWSDSDGYDENMDGIEDLPYQIPGSSSNQDLYPLVHPSILPLWSGYAPIPNLFDRTTTTMSSYTGQESNTNSQDPLFFFTSSWPIHLFILTMIVTVIVKRKKI